MTIEEFNNLNDREAFAQLERCCGAKKWVNTLLSYRPFLTEVALFDAADAVWATCQESDFLEAFTHHPRIGDIASLEKKFATTKAWAGNEQGAVNKAEKGVLLDLKRYNDDYFDKFGFIFIVFATGKTAKEMLDLLLARLPNDRATEIRNAATEQHKITRLRINKLLGNV